MNGIILLWLQSEPMREAVEREGKAWWPVSVGVWPGLPAVAGLGICLLLLFFIIVKKSDKNRRNRETAFSPLPDRTDGSVTQELPVEAVRAAVWELPVEAVQAAGQELYILTEIVYCESKEVIL